MVKDGNTARSWLVIAAGDDRGHGGNDGYDDEPDAYYSWDSTVANSKLLTVGDRIVLRDKRGLIGMSVIEDIEVDEEQKILKRCPRCGKAKIHARAKKRPRYKCQPCGHVFEVPDSRLENVKTYRSRHDAAWTPLDGTLDLDRVRQMCVQPKSIQSLRELKWEEFSAALESEGRSAALDTVRSRLSSEGHRLSLVRIRLGQSGFRAGLLDEFGEVCAVSGGAPKSVLDAGHLYSYAQIGEHHEHGGLLFRKDVHSLFDRGSIAIDPDSLRVDVSPDVACFPAYSGFQGQQVRVRLHDDHRKWLQDHWRQHRNRAS